MLIAAIPAFESGSDKPRFVTPKYQRLEGMKQSKTLKHRYLTDEQITKQQAFVT
jgi:hypothetical protein